eukprot:7563793-Pyramimonas_sp.AAC.1
MCWAGGMHATVTTGAVGGDPCGPRSAVVCGADACECRPGAFGGAPYEATERCAGLGGRMRPRP